MQFDVPTAEEMPLVFDSWARSFRKSPWAGCVPNHLWDQVSRAAAAGIVDRGALITVAVTPIEGAEGRRVMGYAVSEPDRRVLHWLFVKKDYRGVGVGGSILKHVAGDGFWTYTHKTRASQKFLGPRFAWDPVPARTK